MELLSLRRKNTFCQLSFALSSYKPASECQHRSLYLQHGRVQDGLLAAWLLITENCADILMFCLRFSDKPIIHKTVLVHLQGDVMLGMKFPYKSFV